MSIIANNFKVNIKVVLVAILLISGLFATTAYGLEKESTANLNLSLSNDGKSVNIREGSAIVNAHVSVVGPSIYGGKGAVTPALKQSISVLPDTVHWIRTISSPTTIGTSVINVSERGSFYPHMSASGYSTGSMYVKSLDINQ